MTMGGKSLHETPICNHLYRLLSSTLLFQFSSPQSIYLTPDRRMTGAVHAAVSILDPLKRKMMQCSVHRKSLRTLTVLHSDECHVWN